MKTPAIWAKELGKDYDGQTVVDNLNLNVPEGTIYGFIGPSGSGKTTSLRMLTGVTPRTRGEVELLGRKPENLRRKDREAIGYTPQLGVLYPHLSVMDNLLFMASLYGMFLPRRRIKQLLVALKLEDAAHKKLRDTSGGMQRRVALAGAMLHNPRLLFLDEPTAGLDPMLRKDLWAHFEELKSQGRTLFITTQIVSEAAVCDKVGLLVDGQIVSENTPGGLRVEAFGGHVIDMHLSAKVPQILFQILHQHPLANAVHHVPNNPKAIRVTVDKVETDVPILRQVVSSTGVDVILSERYLAPFDDVFVALLERHRARRQALQLEPVSSADDSVPSMASTAIDSLTRDESEQPDTVADQAVSNERHEQATDTTHDQTPTVEAKPQPTPSAVRGERDVVDAQDVVDVVDEVTEAAETATPSPAPDVQQAPLVAEEPASDGVKADVGSSEAQDNGRNEIAAKKPAEQEATEDTTEAQSTPGESDAPTGNTNTKPAAAKPESNEADQSDTDETPSSEAAPQPTNSTAVVDTNDAQPHEATSVSTDNTDKTPVSETSTKNPDDPTSHVRFILEEPDPPAAEPVTQQAEVKAKPKVTPVFMGTTPTLKPFSLGNTNQVDPNSPAGRRAALFANAGATSGFLMSRKDAKGKEAMASTVGNQAGTAPSAHLTKAQTKAKLREDQSHLADDQAVVEASGSDKVAEAVAESKPATADKLMATNFLFSPYAKTREFFERLTGSNKSAEERVDTTADGETARDKQVKG